MQMNNIPDWMQQAENYIPEKDKDGFITRSLLSVMSALSLLKAGSGGNSGSASQILQKVSPSAPVKLIMALVIILLSSCSSNMFFTYTMLAVLMVHMCALEGKKLKRIFTASLAAAAFSALLLIPAVFLGSPHTLLTVSLKVFLSVGLLAMMGATTPWNKITSGLRQFHVPDVFIFTFDITLKYIAVIGDICVDMLDSLKLRSVGKNNTKKKSFSGILGVAFLKSRQMSEEMCGAMACRGFEGEYSKGNKRLLGKADILFLIFTALIILYYLYL